MLQELSESQFRDILKYDNHNINLKHNFKLDKDCENVNILEMRSDDANNEFQGIVYAEIISKNENKVGTIFEVYVPEKFNDTNFARVLIEHALKSMHGQYEIVNFMAYANEDNLQSFIGNGFTQLTNGRMIKGKLSNIKLSLNW